MEKQFTFLTDINQVERIPLLVDELTEELGLDMALSFNLHLALEEAITNVICYAYTDKVQHEFQLDIHTDAETLTFVLTDGGQPFDPTSQAPTVDINQSADERQIGGLGVFLVMQLMDRVTYRRENSQNILIMQKRFK